MRVISPAYLLLDALYAYCLLIIDIEPLLFLDKTTRRLRKHLAGLLAISGLSYKTVSSIDNLISCRRKNTVTYTKPSFLYSSVRCPELTSPTNRGVTRWSWLGWLKSEHHLPVINVKKLTSLKLIVRTMR